MMTKLTASLTGAALTGTLLFGTACESFVEGLNDDPNNFTDITLPLALGQAQLNQASIAGGFPSHLASMWTDQFTGTDRQYISFDDYAINNGSFDDVWEDLYQRGIVHAQIAGEIATEQGLADRAAVAAILEAYYFGETALMFGDVPFSQVNQIDQFTDPTYDTQESVLRGAVDLIGGATAAADLAVSATGGQIYDTDATWGQIGNGFRARYLLGLMDYEGALAAAEASEMDTPAEDLEIISTTTNFGENLYWQFEVEQRTSYLTVDNATRGISYFRSLLSDTTELSRNADDDKTDDSARYAYFIEVDDDFATDNVRYNITDGWAAQTANLSILTSAEVLLIKAEAAARTGDDDLAIEALNEAREYWDTLLGTDNYDELESSDFADSDALLEAILIEKYVSVIGLPAFYDVNRTDNLIGVPSEGANPLAERFLYPSTEQSSNDQFPGLESLTTPLPLYN